MQPVAERSQSRSKYGTKRPRAAAKNRKSLKGKKMSRKGRAPIREVPADPIYNSKLVTKLIKLMYAGQRGKAEKIFIMP